jgi:hypothetical protein
MGVAEKKIHFRKRRRKQLMQKTRHRRELDTLATTCCAIHSVGRRAHERSQAAGGPVIKVVLLSGRSGADHGRRHI